MSDTTWKKCSTCKKEIPYSSKFYECSVSTCKHKRKGFRFCCVQCWDAHLGYMNHREAWAEEKIAPSRAEAESDQHGGTGRTPKKTIVSSSAAPSSSPTGPAAKIQTDTLVVVSKVKKLIKEQSGMSTSQCAIDAFTEKVVGECLDAIDKAKESGRKTVMGRDVV